MVKKYIKSQKEINRLNEWSKFQKGKTFEELYGITKANQLKSDMSKRRKGVRFSEEHKRKLSVLKIGDLNPAKREDVRIKISENLKNNELWKSNLIKSWKNEDRRNKTVKASLLSSNRLMSECEKRLNKLIRLNNLPFNYVGNGKVVINGFCPDFLSKNPKHIIELYGPYHYWKNNPNNPFERDKRRLKAYSSLGYKTLIINAGELQYYRNYQKIVEKIINFITK
jgi:very-short-patch-repair endonuclease